MNLDQARAFLAREFPQNTCTVEAIGIGQSTLRQAIGFEHLRPGGTVSGPTLMALADCAAYVAILSQFGEVALAVTTNLTINFLRKPAADKDVIAECKLLKTGKRLVVCEVLVYSEGLDDAVAQVTATYSIPPQPL
ncbi:PaaI family thioesterase [Candidatus Spongiihabitans sp.]|uniref:PaaI family thioesterase n=1 Tax=Candidatus Spongiihabitans sp. TaxID=3101308 RepID=UPI003C7BDF4A